MLRDAHLAEDVTQGVFTALAQSAPQLSEHPVLSGWLHRTAQNLATKIIRTDARRRAREQEAVAMTEMLSAESDTNWEEIAPHLDAALGELSEPERDALLLRYFERKSAREMAQTLGVSDEAAQKRVSRAVDRLREVFAKRGVTVGAGGLVVVLTANAVQAAPAGLALTISSAAALAGTTVTASTIATATKIIAMTTLQKAAVTAALIVVAGAGMYEAHQASQLRRTNETQRAELVREIQRLQGEKDGQLSQVPLPASISENTNGISDELLRLRAEVTRLRNDAATAAAEIKSAHNSESELAQLMSNNPPVRTLLSTSVTTASWDQAIVTGGWKTPSGTRAVAITTFQPADNANSLIIKTSILEYPEDTGKTLGLDQFNVDGQSASKANTVTRDQAASIVEAAQRINGANILAQPSVSLESGRMAEVQVGDTRQTASGEKYSTGPVMDFIPTISPDGQSVQMVIASHLNYPISTAMLQPATN